MPLVQRFVRHWIHRLSRAGVPEPVESVRFLLSAVLERPVHLEALWPAEASGDGGGDVPAFRWRNLQALPRHLRPEHCERAEAMLQRRLQREPVQFILGEWDFRELNLKLRPPTLIPRPETEKLVDLALELIETAEAKELNVLEVGCGSGAISLSLLMEAKTKRLRVTAVDSSTPAVRLTRENATRHGLDSLLRTLPFRLQNDASSFAELCGLCGGPVDLLISNPPYIPSQEVDLLEPEVRLFEDRIALDGGQDGLSLVRALLGLGSICLRPGGSALLEVDHRHPDQLQRMQLAPSSTDSGLRLRRTVADFAFRPRYVEFVRH